MARAKRHHIPGHVWQTPVKYAPPQLNKLRISRGKHSTGQAFNGVNNPPMPQKCIESFAARPVKCLIVFNWGREQRLCRERKNHTGHTGQRKKEQGSRASLSTPRAFYSMATILRSKMKIQGLKTPIFGTLIQNNQKDSLARPQPCQPDQPDFCAWLNARCQQTLCSTW